MMRDMTNLIFLLLVAGLTGCCGGQALQFDGDVSGRRHLQSFIVVGDTQRTSFWEFWRESNDRERKVILKQIATENPAFLLHLGDLVYQGSDGCHWQEFEEFSREIRKRGIPVMPVLGNHEYYGSNTSALDQFFQRFPHLERRRWYAFRFRYVACIVLNSNFDDLEEDERREQNEWYAAVLDTLQRDSSVKTILVAAHHPPYTNSTVVSPDERVRQFFVPPFTAATKAKLFFSGHCHSFEHFVVDNKHFFVSGGGGGPRQPLKTEADEDWRRDLYKGPKKRRFHYCRVSVLNEGLQIDMVPLAAAGKPASSGYSVFIP